MPRPGSPGQKRIARGRKASGWVVVVCVRGWASGRKRIVARSFASDGKRAGDYEERKIIFKVSPFRLPFPFCLFSSRFSPPVLNFQEPTRLPTICPLPFVPATFPLGQRVRSRVPLSIKSFPPFYSGERLVEARTDSLRVDVFERGTVLDNIRGIDPLRWLW